MRPIRPKPIIGTPLNWGDPLTRGLVGCWAMNERGGSTIRGVVAGRVATLSSGASWSMAPEGTAITLNGTTGQITLPNLAGSLVRNITVAAYVNLTSAGNFPMAISALDDGAPGSSGFELRTLSSTGQPQFLCDDGSRPSATGPSSIVNAGWVMLTGVCRDTSIEIWVDNILAGSSARTSSTITYGLFPKFAAGYRVIENNYFWPGSMGGIWFWSRSLSSPEIARIAADPWGMFSRKEFAVANLPPASSFNPAWAFRPQSIGAGVY
jgi:hypothetical protein